MVLSKALCFLATALALHAFTPEVKTEIRDDEDLPPALQEEQFSRYFEAVKPYEGEWRWREEIAWVGTIHEARARAAQENKPILAWMSANSPPLGAT